MHEHQACAAHDLYFQPDKKHEQSAKRGFPIIDSGKAPSPTKVTLRLGTSAASMPGRPFAAVVGLLPSFVLRHLRMLSERAPQLCR